MLPMHLFLQITFLRRLYLFLTIGTLLTVVAPIGKAEDQLKDLLELRGYARIGGLLEFSVYNKEEKRSRWLAINQSMDGYRIREYDRDRNEIIIEFNGRKGRIPLEASRIAEMQPAAQTASQPASGQPNSRSQSTNPSQRAGSNPSINIPPPPTSPPPGRTDNSNINRSRRQPTGGGYTSGRGERLADHDTGPIPGDNRPGDNSDRGDDIEDDSSWGSIGEPPPIPSTPPPSYNPAN